MNRKRKILFIVTKSNWGGAQRYVYDLATRIPKERFEIVVVCGGTGLLKERLEAKHIRVIPTRSLERDMRFFQDIKAAMELVNIIRKERPDIVHLNSSKAGGLGALASRLVRVPRIIFTAHGWHFNEDRGVVIKSVTWFLSLLTQTLAHTTIAVSKYDTDRAPLRSKTVLIHNGLSPLTFLTREQAREALHLPSDSIVIGSIGELTSNKNYARLIHAMTLLDRRVKEAGITLDIIGEGEERERLEAKLKEIKVIEKQLDMRLNGFKENAFAYLPAYDIFVLPSLKEGLPYALLEAGQAGLPTVASRVGGIPDIIEDGKMGILVDPKNPRELARALETLAGNRALRLRYGQALKRSVETHFSVDRMVESTIALYRS
jgi:glycosyltransferase involved in cell wall biosynthesis